MKTRNCGDCAHANYGYEYMPKLVCAKGHKPRYYEPKTIQQTYDWDWGYKRKCADFKEKK